MNRRKMQAFFESGVSRGQMMALATVFETQGSTYSKAGARMLIDANGVFRGMLSGGCLEGDLAIRAQTAIESGHPQIASYDLSSGNDEIWGLGVGCDGIMRIFIQALAAATDYEPYRTIAALELGRHPAQVVIVIESDSPLIAPGATVIASQGQLHNFGIDARRANETMDRLVEYQAGAQGLHDMSFDGATCRLLSTIIEPVARLLVLGGGLDAEPLLRMATETGWRCTVVDHRPAYIDNNDFATADSRICVSTDELAKSVDFKDFDLAIVMSHHLATDRNYLQQLSQSEISYIGLLGPPGRRDRLLSELGAAVGTRLEGRLHGPAGINLGGRGPEAIALSIVAEMQQHLARTRRD